MIENVIIFLQQRYHFDYFDKMLLIFDSVHNILYKFFCIRDIPFQNFGSLRIPTQFSRLGSIYLSFGGFRDKMGRSWIWNWQVFFFSFAPLQRPLISLAVWDDIASLDWHETLLVLPILVHMSRTCIIPAQWTNTI